MAGCWAAELSDEAGASDPRAGLSGTPGLAHLPGSTDEAPDELTVLVRPHPAPPVVPERARSPGRFGLRFGYMVVTATRDSDWDPAVAVGVFYRSAGEVAYEFGIDYVSLAGTLGDGEGVESRTYHFRCAAILRRRNGAGGGPGPYLLGGAMAGLESGTWGLTGDSFVAGGGGINLGFGVGPTEGRWDARIVYSIFVVSEEVKGAIQATVGFPF